VSIAIKKVPNNNPKILFLFFIIHINFFSFNTLSEKKALPPRTSTNATLKPETQETPKIRHSHEFASG